MTTKKYLAPANNPLHPNFHTKRTPKGTVPKRYALTYVKDREVHEAATGRTYIPLPH